VDIADVETCLAIAERMHAEKPFAAVVSFTEWGLESAAAIFERLSRSGVRGNAARPVELTRDKTAMRDLLAKTSIPSIPYRRCARPADILEFQGTSDWPVVIKPAKGAGSAGVTLVGNASEVAAAWERAHAADGGEAVIVEAFVSGEEFSVDTMSYDGSHELVAIAEKVTTGAPHFVELGHQVPARLDPATQAAVAATAFAFLDAIGQQTGPAHTEFKLLDRQVTVIESQTRTGGDQIWELNRLAVGYDLHMATMRYLLTGERRDRAAASAQPRAAAVRFFTAAPGRIVSIEGAERATACPGVKRFKLDAEPGDPVAPLTCSAARLGYVVCDGATMADAIARAVEARASVRITTEPCSSLRDR
jgi:biotin carboxylase